MNKQTVKIFRTIALVLVVITFTWHISTYVIAPTFEYEFLLFPLALGAFGVFGPAIFLMKEVMTENNPKSFWKEMLKKLPVFYRVTMPVLFFYVFFNFFYSIGVLNKGGLSPEITTDGKYVLEYKGEIKEEITVQQYHKHRAYTFRGMSGHFMLFQYVALIMLTRVMQKREEET